MISNRKQAACYLLGGVALGAALSTLVANLGTAEKKLGEPLDPLYGTDDIQFRRDLDSLLGPPIVGDNAVDVLVNGDRIFAAMLEGIRQAQRTLTFETFIYWSGSIGRKFSEALAERARAGVRVHVLLDWVGSVKVDEALVARMRAAGVEVERFHRPHWSHLPRFNNRTHRKLLIVDGELGFTGGVGIADQWRGDAEDADHWRDTHFRVRGPLVAQMQAVFTDNWMKATRRVLRGADYFPEQRPAGTVDGQMFSSSPSGGSESMHLFYLMAINAARRTIDLSSSYFVPDELAIAELVAALRRGVRVRIVVPGRHIDSPVTRRASRARWGALLEAGALLAEFQPTMYHCKVLIVDELLVSVGSTNFDNRSFRLNDEANLNLFDAGFAAEQTRLFEADLARARRIGLAEWRRRPLAEKAIEHTASLLGSQL